MKESIKIILLVSWPLYLNDFYLIPYQNASALIWPLDFFAHVIIPTATIWYLIKNKKLKLIETGLTKPIELTSIFAGIILCIIQFIVLRVYIYPELSNALPRGLFNGYPFPPYGTLRLFAILYAAFAAGIFEEIIYRGIVTSQLEKFIKSKISVFFVSCIIFAGIHWGGGPVPLIYTFLWALIPTYWYMKKRKIWGLMVCHTFYDCLVSLLF